MMKQKKAGGNLNSASVSAFHLQPTMTALADLPLAPSRLDDVLLGLKLTYSPFTAAAELDDFLAAASSFFTCQALVPGRRPFHEQLASLVARQITAGAPGTEERRRNVRDASLIWPLLAVVCDEGIGRGKLDTPDEVEEVAESSDESPRCAVHCSVAPWARLVIEVMLTDRAGIIVASSRTTNTLATSKNHPPLQQGRPNLPSRPRRRRRIQSMMPQLRRHPLPISFPPHPSQLQRP
jgi:hypothetical protein